MQDHLQILSVAQGPFVLNLVRSSRGAGIRFDGSWEDISAFIKRVNDGWGADPGAGAGWFPPRVFDGVPRLHLSRTLTILAIATYFIEARQILPAPLVKAGMPLAQCWYGAPQREDGAGSLPDIQEVLWVFSPPPPPASAVRAVVDTYGLMPIRPEVGLGVIYAFARQEGDIQGYSLPFLERDGKLLPVVREGPLLPAISERFFTELPNLSRSSRHLERYFELYDISEAADRAWNRATVQLAQRLFGAEVVVA